MPWSEDRNWTGEKITHTHTHTHTHSLITVYIPTVLRHRGHERLSDSSPSTKSLLSCTCTCLVQCQQALAKNTHGVNLCLWLSVFVEFSCWGPTVERGWRGRWPPGWGWCRGWPLQTCPRTWWEPSAPRATGAAASCPSQWPASGRGSQWCPTRGITGGCGLRWNETQWDTVRLDSNDEFRQYSRDNCS